MSRTSAAQITSSMTASGSMPGLDGATKGAGVVESGGAWSIRVSIALRYSPLSIGMH